MFNMDKSKLLDSGGRPLTQSLFLELGYSDYAIYTLKDQDHEYQGKVYPSLKRLYLELEDVTEYEFATTYLLGWNHWIRLYANKQLTNYIDGWRLELEYKLRSRAAKEMIKLANEGQYQAVKWVADRGWSDRGAGRPSKSEKAAYRAVEERINSEYSADIIRLRASE